MKRYIFDCGLVASGIEQGCEVLSCRSCDSPRIDGSWKWKFWFGEWDPERRIEVLLNLRLAGSSWFEGAGPAPIDIGSLLGHDLLARHRSLGVSVASSMYFLYAAMTHLRNLLKSYAALTTVVGPTLPFDNSNPIFVVRSPESYAHFDACMVALRSFCDSIRFTTWQALERSGGIPRSIRSLSRSELPPQLRECLDQFITGPFDEIERYRDNAVHYAPLAVRDNTHIILSKDMIHAEIWLPINPEARSHGKFRYEQKDALRTAKRLLEGTLDFASKFYSLVGSIYEGR